MLATPADNHTQNRWPRLALLGRKLVEPFNVFIRQVGEDASHDILISYHDIMSRYAILYFVEPFHDLVEQYKAK